jgi:hypothetical protein
MKCYYHPQEDAVGICKACLRGLCHVCAVDLEVALACRDRHENAVRTLLQINRNAAALGATYRHNRFLAPSFAIILGLLYAGWDYSSSKSLSYGSMIGFAIVVFGVVLLLINWRTTRQMDGKNT